MIEKMNYKFISKPQNIIVDGKKYEYQIIKWEGGRKTIRYKGIVTYIENEKIKKILSKEISN